MKRFILIIVVLAATPVSAEEWSAVLARLQSADDRS